VEYSRERRTTEGSRGFWIRVFVTPDKNIRYQQNLTARRIAIIVLGNAQWPVLQRYVDRVVTAVNTAKPGTYFEVEIPDR
jgi:hypothetical protein